MSFKDTILFVSSFLLGELTHSSLAEGSLSQEGERKAGGNRKKAPRKRDKATSTATFSGSEGDPFLYFFIIYKKRMPVKFGSDAYAIRISLASISHYISMEREASAEAYVTLYISMRCIKVFSGCPSPLLLVFFSFFHS